MIISKNLFLCCLALAQETPEEQLIEQLNTLEIKLHRLEYEAQNELDHFLSRLDRHKTPRAWLQTHVLARTEDDQGEFAKIAERALQEAIENHDEPLAFRLTNWAADVGEAAGASDAELQKIFTRFEVLCPPDTHSVWCGRLYDRWANYYYSANDQAQALKKSHKAISILEHATGRSAYFLHDAQTMLSSIFSANAQTKDQAMQLTLANYAWYEENGYFQMASLEAINMTIYLDSQQPGYFDKVVGWLDRAERHAKATGGMTRMSFVVYSRARFMAKSERYLEAIKPAQEARDLFINDGNMEFAALSELIHAQALIKLNRMEEAKAALKQVEKIAPENHDRSRMKVMEARISIAESQGKFDQAFQLLKVFHQKWEEKRENEAKNGLNRLNAELGLKLEEERNAKLAKENELQKQKIRETEVIRIFFLVMTILAIISFIFLAFALHQTRKAKRNHSKLQRILDHIDEGLLTFDRSRKISDDYSKRLPEILGSTQSLVGRDIMEVIFSASQMAGEELSMIHEILEATFLEDQLAWELNAENLCQEIRFRQPREQVVELGWTPIFDEHRKLKRILLSLTDTTEKKAMEMAFGQQRRYLQALPDTLKEMLVGQPQHIARLLNATGDTLIKLQDESADASLLRNLHTQKGTARALGLKALSQDLHDLETILQPKTGHSPTQSLHDQLQGIQDRLGEYRAIAEVLKNTQSTMMSGRLSLAHTLQAHIPSWLEYMENAGQRLHKIGITDEVLRWQAEHLHILESICVHAVNNSLDHGFLEADAPIHLPAIEITARLQSGSIELEIRDNGQGLNIGRLEQLAHARGFVPKSHETIADVVFCDGFSLAKSLSISSGRGIGLGAVKELVERNGGEVHLLNQPQSRGSILKARWPANQIGAAI